MSQSGDEGKGARERPCSLEWEGEDASLVHIRGKITLFSYSVLDVFWGGLKPFPGLPGIAPTCDMAWGRGNGGLITME